MKGLSSKCYLHLMLHLNMGVTPEECKEIILDETKKENENLDFETLGINEVNSILQTASSLFLSNIVIFYSVGSEYQYIVVKAKDKNIEGSLYNFPHNNQHYESPSFNKEQKNPYESIIDFSDNETTYDNLGRLHSAIPHTGEASLFLRSNKYNSSSIVTHITDLHSILNSKM